MDNGTTSFTGLGLGRAASLASPLTTILYLVGFSLVYHICRALYNISPLHPLYRFPGPKLAAATYLYEGYYDWILTGRYTKAISQMHKTYGPIVRISPDELHCSDPYFTDEIYAGPGRVRDKWQHAMNSGGTGPLASSSFSTIPHELHRMRRGALSRFFSRQNVLKLEDEVREFSQATVDKMLQQSAGGPPFEVKQAYNCFTADVISQYAFGEPMGFVAQDGWEPNFATWTESFLSSAYALRFNPLLRRMTSLMPMFSDYMGEDIKRIMNQMNVVIPGYIRAALKDPDNGRIFAEIMESKAMPPEEKTMYRLSGEGFLFLVAGTETTAATLTCITYHLLAQPKIQKSLMQALKGMDASNLKWMELEQRPYVWAVVQEALRMMPGMSHRGARVIRGENLIYKSKDGNTEWVIKDGTAISMSAMINHWDQEIFPDPDEFIPERWLDNGQPNYKLQKYLLAFGRGARSCMGEQLAYAEMYHMTALMAMRVVPRARLYETTVDDITYDHDLIVVQTKKGAISVRIEIQ